MSSDEIIPPPEVNEEKTVLDVAKDAVTDALRDLTNRVVELEKKTSERW